MNELGSNARRAERHNVRQIASVTYGIEEQRTETVGIVLDVSATGIRLQMGEPPKKHRMVRVTLMIKDHAVTMIGRVVRVSPCAKNQHEVGIEFDPEATTALPAADVAARIASQKPTA